MTTSDPATPTVGRRLQHRTSYDDTVDLDTNQYGVDGPFEQWEGDHTGLVHVLWHLRHRGVFLTHASLDTVADAILRSRWFAAASADISHVVSLATVLRYDPSVDPDTNSKGHAAPLHPWEADTAALVRVLRYAHTQGLTVADADPLASIITRSRWLAAARANHA